MKEFLPVLVRCPLFRDIAEGDIFAMLGCLGARTAQKDKGEYVLMEGDRADQVGILLKGKMQIIREDLMGNRSVVASIGEGQLFAETFACAGVESLPVSILCMEKCTVMLMDIRRITHSCSNACAFHQQVVMNLLQGLAEKTLLFNRKIHILSRKTTREKLMAYLLDEAKRRHSTQFTIPFDRQSLADYLGVERSALSAEIGRMKRDGILETERSYFRLLQGSEGK